MKKNKDFVTLLTRHERELFEKQIIVGKRKLVVLAVLIGLCISSAIFIVTQL